MAEGADHRSGAPAGALRERVTIETPVSFQHPLPDRVDTVVIGGGVIGIFSALYLAREGQRVLVCEKGRVAAEQSSRNWGWIRQQGRDFAELPIMMQSLGLWHEADRQTNGQCGVTTCGTYYLARTEEEMAGFEPFLDCARQHGLDTRLLSARELSEAVFSGGPHDFGGALCTPSDARGEPWTAVPAVARLAAQEGVLIRENCAVRGLDIANREIRGVTTEAGKVACDQVVLCAGVWSSLFLRRHGIHIPQLSVYGTVARTEPLPDVFSGCSWDDEIAFRRRLDGGYSLARGDLNGFGLGPDAFRHMRAYLPVLRKSWRGIAFRPGHPGGYPNGWTTPRAWHDDEVTPFERVRVIEPAVDARTVSILRDRFAARFPEIGRPGIRDSWAGLIDVMPDVVPVVDRVPTVEGLVAATGMSGHGFGIGPGMGRAIARMVLRRPAEHALERFRFSRFSDGSALDLRTSL